MKDAAAELDPSLVVIGLRRRGGLSRFVMGSVSDELLREIDQPVLCVKESGGPTPDAPSHVAETDPEFQGSLPSQTGHTRSTMFANTEPLTPLRFLKRSAEVFPDRLAVIHGDREWTYQDFERDVRRFATALLPYLATPGPGTSHPARSGGAEQRSVERGADVYSPSNFKSWGIADMTVPGKILQFLPILAPSMMVTLEPIQVPSPISTSPAMVVKGSTITFL